MQHYPPREAFHEYAREGRLVPVYRQLMGDMLTPVLAYARLAEEGLAFLLESVTGGEKISRYSFLGVDPAVVFQGWEERVAIRDNRTGMVRELECACPLDELRDLMAKYRAVHLPELPRFAGGAVGYFAYDVVRTVERLPNAPRRSLGLPDIYVGLYDTMVVFDNVNKTCKVVAYADCEALPIDAAYDAACLRVDDLVRRLAAPGELPLDEAPDLATGEIDFESNFEKPEFERAVERCKEYIAAGDIFQVVLSQRLGVPCAASPFAIYRNLRVINPSPYMFCLQFPELSLVGASPEVMVRVEDGTITVRPIAGTRRRGANDAEDAALAEDLLADEKERAEHTMLLDLGRNDVGRVAGYGSVRITEQMVIERYSHVMHIVSNVEGDLREGQSAFEAFKSALPAGTLSGAPKVRAMEIIDEFEPDRRGPYGGAVGYVDFSGNLDTCIAIRTIVLQDGKAYVQAGAGIVADSEPAREYEETREKASALLRALKVSEA